MLDRLWHAFWRLGPAPRPAPAPPLANPYFTCNARLKAAKKCRTIGQVHHFGDDGDEAGQRRQTSKRGKR